MNSESKSEDALYAAARHLADPGARAAFLDAACSGNPALRDRLDKLLSAGPEADEFFNRNAVDLHDLPLLSTEDATLVIPPNEQSGERIGRYKLLQPLGEGGMGAVWMAEQREPMVRRVALKIIKLGMDTREVIARFEAERQALAMMDHPCIAKVFDAGTTESGRPFFVMELVRGVPITAYCDEQKLGVRERLALFIQVCQAIQHAHQKGIIHRDLKPSNILVTAGDDSEPLPKVIDFGIAKATGQALTDRTLFTQLAQIIGTPAYMSPEQAGMGPLDIDTRSDIYSLGVLLYELLTGRPPFDPRELISAGLEEMRRVIREKEPPKPSTRISSLSEKELTGLAAHCSAPAPRLVNLVRGDLDWIVMKALDKNRNRRYESATNLAADIQRHMAAQPVLARPPGAGYLLSRFVKRHKFGFAAGTAVTLALVGGITAATWGFLRSESARKKANDEATKATAANVENKKNLHLASMADYASALKVVGESVDAERSGEQAVGVGGKSRWREAVALLTRSLEREPENRHAALCLHEILRQHPTMKSDCPVKLCQHEEFLTDASFSPDGGRILTACEDHTARLWDASTGTSIGQAVRHDSIVTGASFSQDGSRFVTVGGEDKTARVWNAWTGAPLGAPIRLGRTVSNASLSPDGTKVVIWHKFTTNNTVRVRDAITGEAPGALMRHGNGVNSVMFSPDGTRIITASNDGRAQIWDAGTGKPVGGPMRPGAQVGSARFSPDGTKIVTACYDYTAQIWDAGTGKALGGPMRHGTAVSEASFSPDGTRIVTADYNHTAQIWDAATGEAIGKPMPHPRPPTGGSWSFLSVGFSPDGTMIVTVNSDTVQIWDAVTGKALGEPMRHQFKVRRAEFSPDGTKLMTAGEDTALRMWDVVTVRGRGEPLRHLSVVQSASFSPNSTKVVTTSLDAPLRIWDASTGEPPGESAGRVSWIESFIGSDGTDSIPHLVRPIGHLMDFANISPNGDKVVAVRGMTASVRDLMTGKPLGPPLQHEERSAFLWHMLPKFLPIARREPLLLWGARFSPDGAKVLTASTGDTARLWDAGTSRSLGEPMVHERDLYGARFSPDGSMVATASEDGVRFWDANTGKALGGPILCSGPNDVSFSPGGDRVVTLNSDAKHAQVWHVAGRSAVGEPMRHDGPVLTATFSPDGGMVVTASRDATARVWNAANGRAVSAPMRHAGPVVMARFSPDGTMVVTASDDGSAQVWDAVTGYPLGGPMGHDGEVVAASFNHDGRRLITASVDGTARLWEVPAKDDARSIAAITLGVLAWAKSIAGLRFSENGELQVIPDEERIAAMVSPSLPPGPWADLAKWINTPASQRTIDVKSRFSPREIAVRERDFNGDGSVESLKSALKYNPAVPLARLFLATAMEEKENIVKAPKDRDPGLPQRAAFLRRYDLDALAREEGKMKKEELAALWVRAAKHLLALPPETKIGVGPKPTTAREEALQAARISVTLAPGDAAARELVKKAEAAQ